MRDIYLIDFENVASEGLSGITFLSPEDQVIIFYSNNSNRLTMKMHILIGKSVCRFNYFEVTVGGKNALDHQISTWLGFLIGTKAADRNYYIVSKDMGYKFVASFWRESELRANVRCVESVRAASRLDRRGRRETQELSDESKTETVPETAEAPEPDRSPILPEPATVDQAIASAVQTVAETKSTVPDAIAEAVWDAYTQEGREQHRDLPEALNVPVSQPEEPVQPESPEPVKEEKYVPGAAFWAVPAKKFVPEASPEPEKPSAPAQEATLESPARTEETAVEAESGAPEILADTAQTASVQPDHEAQDSSELVESPAQPEEPGEAPAEAEEKYIPGAAFWAVPAKTFSQPEPPADPSPVAPAPAEQEDPAENASEGKRHREAYPKEPVELPLDASDEDLAAEAAADRVRTRSRGARSRSSRSDSRRSTRQSRQEQVKSKETPKEPTKSKEPEKDKEQPKAALREAPKPATEKKSSRQPKAKAKEEPRTVDIAAMIAPYPELQEQHLQQLISENQRQKLCNHLRKHLGQEKGLALYNEIKKKAWH